MNHALFPFGASFPAIANAFVILDESRPVSATNALLAALVAPYQREAQADSVYEDLARVAYELSQISDSELDYVSSAEHDNNSYVKTALAVLISAVEQGAASPAALKTLAAASTRDNPQDDQLRALLARAASLLPDP